MCIPRGRLLLSDPRANLPSRKHEVCLVSRWLTPTPVPLHIGHNILYARVFVCMCACVRARRHAGYCITIVGGCFLDFIFTPYGSLLYSCHTWRTKGRFFSIIIIVWNTRSIRKKKIAAHAKLRGTSEKRHDSTEKGKSTVESCCQIICTCIMI